MLCRNLGNCTSISPSIYQRLGNFNGFSSQYLRHIPILKNCKRLIQRAYNLKWNEILLSIIVWVSWDFSAFPGLFQSIGVETRLKLHILIQNSNKPILGICDILPDHKSKIFLLLFFCREYFLFPYAKYK